MLQDSLVAISQAVDTTAVALTDTLISTVGTIADTTVTVNPELINVLVSGGSIVATLGVSLLLGAFKKYILPTEGKLIDLIKPIQPVLVTILPPLVAIALSAIGAASQEDAATLIAGAPLSGIIIVTLRELLRRLVGAK